MLCILLAIKVVGWEDHSVKPNYGETLYRIYACRAQISREQKESFK